MRKLKSYLPLLFVAFCICYTLLNPYRIAFHARNAIKICAFSLVPTLFVFMVFSRMLANLCFFSQPSGKVITLLSRLLNLPPHLIPICISGLFCGAPSGAFAISRIYQRKGCSEKQAERACIISNNCSAAFILGFVCSVIQSKTASLYILLSNITATLIVYLLFFRGTQYEEKSTTLSKNSCPRLCEMITDSISSSVTSTIALCGYVLFFYTFTQTLCDIILPIAESITSRENSSVFVTVISSFTEITSGVLRMSELDREKAIVICASFVAFTSLSMIFQVCDVMKRCRISVKNYVTSKILCGLVSPVITTLLLLLSPKTIVVSAQYAQKNTGGFKPEDVFSLVFVTLITFIGAYILTRLDKKHKK